MQSCLKRLFSYFFFFPHSVRQLNQLLPLRSQEAYTDVGSAAAELAIAKSDESAMRPDVIHLHLNYQLGRLPLLLV